MRADAQVCRTLESGLADVAAPAAALKAISGLAVAGFGSAWEIPLIAKARSSGLQACHFAFSSPAEASQ